ncbi:hypothetical protein JCM8115_004912 [Rhodotorula mucilaginosa]|uniref:Haloacid dehalogenase n=1 Tax=Rhodotorula mucilaginosa TaxID=5537 RepID=A0A9P7B3E9_RHOMI|nr:hypothetical protein C6P46_006758 [Rhodotorula mucilaginosa]
MVIRRVLLDAFGTLFSPREPVHVQYTKVARSFGLVVDEAAVKSAFKQAFKHWTATHPLYGKRSTPPLDPADWWRGVILDTFRNAGVAEQRLAPISDELSNSLVRRFWGSEGYELHAEVDSFLQRLHALPYPPRDNSVTGSSSSQRFPPPVVVSNTDPAVLKILDSLGVTDSTFAPRAAGIRHDQIFTTWLLEEDKKDVRFWEEVLRRLRSETGGEGLDPGEVLVVGDELVSDYETPRRAGFRTLLLRRTSPNGEHARASYEDEKDGPAAVETVQDLLQVLEFVQQENS